MSARPLLGLAAAVLLAGCGRKDAAPPATLEAVAVQTATVAVERLPVMVEAPATIRPAERATLSAKIAGAVAALPVVLGQSVEPGGVLVTLAAPEVEARVRQAQAQLAEADRNVERTRTLVSKGVNAPETLRDTEDRLRFAQATLAEAEAMLSFATVRAPFAGVVTAQHALVGDFATPGQPLLVLESTRRLRAEAAVPERAAASLRIGGEVAVRLDDVSAPVPGRVEEISGAADALSRSVLVKAALPPGVARSGQFARLLVPHGETDALLVSAAALARFGQMERVFVATDGRAVLRLVKTGRVVGERVEVLSGLNPGERLVLAPPATLRDGQPLAIRP
jgi:RND family efflux transporter MFP subunit